MKVLNAHEHNLAVEFTAAIEAATGGPQSTHFAHPMIDADILEGYNQILSAKRPDWGLDILARTGVLKETLPEVFALVGFGDSIKHKDVWVHTQQVVRQTPQQLTLRWAALLHDIGKVKTRKFTPSGQVTFIGHPELGARMFDKIAQRLPFPEAPKAEIRFLIAAHLRGAAYQESWTDSAVRRFAKDTGDYLENLLDLSRADITSKYEEKVRRGLVQINALAKRVSEIRAQDAKPKALPKGLGERVIGEFRIAPGRKLGAVMQKLTATVERGDLPPGADYQVYVDYLKTHPELL